MSWWGKLIGGTFGFMLGGPLGALLGVALGHNFDAGLRRAEEVDAERLGFNDRERTQTAFFTATFAVMGHLAKADGQVTRDEIELANVVMAQMRLSPEQRRTAQRLFQEGKAPHFPLDEVLDQLRRECHRRHSLLRMFLEILLQAAYADGVVHPGERQVLLHAADRLGFSRHEFNTLESRVGTEWRYRHARGAGAGEPGGYRLEDAYALLNISPDAEPAEIKRAYRRMMSEHHPDKLVSKGLPEEMTKIATEKTQEIKAAYDAIREARGL